MTSIFVVYLCGQGIFQICIALYMLKKNYKSAKLQLEYCGKRGIKMRPNARAFSCYFFHRQLRF